MITRSDLVVIKTALIGDGHWFSPEEFSDKVMSARTVASGPSSKANIPGGKLKGSGREYSPAPTSPPGNIPPPVSHPLSQH